MNQINMIKLIYIFSLYLWNYLSKLYTVLDDTLRMVRWIKVRPNTVERPWANPPFLTRMRTQIF